MRGNFNIGGNGTGVDSLANTALSFVFRMPAEPTPHLIRAGQAAPAECAGSYETPEAAPGHLCVYEVDILNTDGVLLNDVTTDGATIFIFSNAAGNYFSFGSWAATAP